MSTATVAPRVRALPTAFDPASGPTTVATPSCSCCSCCCLNALAAGIGYNIGATHALGTRNQRSRTLAAVLSVVAVIAGVTVFAFITGKIDDFWPGLAVGVVIYMALSVTAHRLVGAGWHLSILSPLAVLTVGAVVFFVEIFGAFFTVFVIELLSPGTLALAIWAGKRMNQGPKPPPPWPPAPNAPFTPTGLPPVYPGPPPTAPPPPPPPPGTAPPDPGVPPPSTW